MPAAAGIQIPVTHLPTGLYHFRVYRRDAEGGIAASYRAYLRRPNR
ncbi:MAG: hypothetical protein ACRD11_02075 [Terriglobia bacterium]